MGQVMSFGLTQHDVAELMEYTNHRFNQQEIEGLYRRFRRLDRGRKGFLTSEELSAIPELCINPLAKRISYLYEGVNFREFLGILSAYSPRASQSERVRHLFSVFDVDGDGVVSGDDLELMLRMLAGSALSDDEVHGVMSAVFQDAGCDPARGLKLPHFEAPFNKLPALVMAVEVPPAY